MADNESSPPPGEPGYCSVCEAPIVLYESAEYGYHLVCACDGPRVSLTDALANESLFTPLTGRWSQVDDIDPWDDSEIGFEDT